MEKGVVMLSLLLTTLSSKRAIVIMLVLMAVSGLVFSFKSMQSKLNSYEIKNAQLMQSVDTQKELITYQQEAIELWKIRVDETARMYQQLKELKIVEGKRGENFRTQVREIERLVEDENLDQATATADSLYHDLIGMLRDATAGNTK